MTRVISNSRDTDSGPLSFLQCATPGNLLCNDARSPTNQECDYDINPPGLYSAVHTRQWGLALDRIKVFPEEAKIWVHRMGIEESDESVESDSSRLATPRNADSIVDGNEVKKVMRWRMLPIHAAIIFNAPLDVVTGLLKAYPQGTTLADDQGMLPLHLAFRAQCDEDVVLALLDVYPEAMERGDLKGRVPSQLAPKNITLSYQDVIADAFLKSPSCYFHAARVAAVDRHKMEVELLGEIQAVQYNAKKEMEEANEVFESTTQALNDDIEQLVFENSELKEKMEWYETKYEGAEEKEQVLVDHTNSLAERLRLTSLSEEHLATKLAKLEGKLMMKTQELDDYKAESQSNVRHLEERLQELERTLDKTHIKAKSLTEKLQQKIKENNELEVKFDHERKLFEKQIESSRECLMELIASSKDEKKIFESDSRELREQLKQIQSELSKNNQVPQSVEQRLDILQNEILSSRITQAQEKADASIQLENLQREINSRVTISHQDEGARSYQAMSVTSPVSPPTPTPADTVETQSMKQSIPSPTTEPEVYVCQTRDDIDCIDDADSLVALTELTDEQREALENLDLSGTKEEIASTLSRVPGLTKNQVNLLVDVAASLAV